MLLNKKIFPTFLFYKTVISLKSINTMTSVILRFTKKIPQADLPKG